MGLLLITTPCGKEEAAKLEVLDCIFHADSEAEFLPQNYRGLLLLNTKLSSDEAASLVRNCPTAYIHRVIPVDLMVRSDISSIVDAVLRLVPQRITKIRVECQRRGRHITSSRDVEVAVGSALKTLGHTIDIRSPEAVVRIDIIGEWTTISVGPPERYVKKIRGML
ncbi:MAG: THUMP domain-containing protein [Candidatus Methanomethylicaceae archaeon]